jgi:hypothetical protein
MIEGADDCGSVIQEVMRLTSILSLLEGRRDFGAYPVWSAPYNMRVREILEDHVDRKYWKTMSLE